MRIVINPNHFRPGRVGPRTRGAYVLVIQFLDRLLVKIQFVGNVLDRGASAAPANIVGKALRIPRVGCPEGKPLAVHFAAVAAAFPSYLNFEVLRARLCKADYGCAASSGRPSPIVPGHNRRGMVF